MTSWEIGVRQNAGARVSVDVAYLRQPHHRSVVSRHRLRARPIRLTRRLLNAGKGRTQGFEFGSTVRPASWLTARQTYTFTNARITENELAPLTVNKRIPYVPRHTAGSSLTAARGAWTGTLTGRYQSDVFSTDTNTDTTGGVPAGYDGFFEADLSASVRAHRLVTLDISVENLLARRYHLFYRNPGRVVLAGVRLRY